MQNEGGLVSHIFLSMDSDFIFFPFVWSHFLDLNFCFKNPKMSVPGFVPHDASSPGLPPTVLLLENARWERKSCWV